MEKVIELYKSGLSIRKVSDETGISATQVRRILKKNNIQARSLRTESVIEEDIVRRYVSGESSEQIAEDLEIVGSTVCRILKRNNIQLRSREESKIKYRIKEDIVDTSIFSGELPLPKGRSFSLDSRPQSF
jgi:DNA invertase Pin-like site-specific DNA recombinase